MLKQCYCYQLQSCSSSREAYWIENSLLPIYPVGERRRKKSIQFGGRIVGCCVEVGDHTPFPQDPCIVFPSHNATSTCHRHLDTGGRRRNAMGRGRPFSSLHSSTSGVFRLRTDWECWQRWQSLFFQCKMVPALESNQPCSTMAGCSHMNESLFLCLNGETQVRVDRHHDESEEGTMNDNERDNRNCCFGWR